MLAYEYNVVHVCTINHVWPQTRGLALTVADKKQLKLYRGAKDEMSPLISVCSFFGPWLTASHSTYVLINAKTFCF